jgi:hypothetical protein
MRTPTDLYEAWQWYRDALAGKRPPITTEPHPGFYQRRLVRGGVWVPVAIWLEQEIDPLTGELTSDEELLCLVNGEFADVDEVWTYCAGNPIAESEYRFLEARHKWARAHAPNDPFARPSRRVDPLSIAPVF